MQGNNIISIIVLAVGILGAFMLGSAIGTEDRVLPVLVIGGLIALATINRLRTELWILIPIFWFWTGKIALLPLPFTIRNGATLFVIGFTLIAFTVGGVRIKGKLNIVDGCVALLLLDVAVTFAMNPMGLRSMSSATVGARPYFEIGLAAAAYLIISNQSLDSRRVRNLVRLILVSSAVLCLGNFLARHTPLGWTLWYINTSWAPTMEGSWALGASIDRVSAYLHFSGMVLLYLFSLGNPLITLNPVKWFRFIPLVLATAGVMISGFRSAVVLYGAAFVASTYLYGKARALFASVVLGVLAIIFLVALNTVVSLPLPIQRALSFLPGDWDRMVAADAESSGEWRFEMWEIALTSDKMIKNKWLGDGFGFSGREMAILDKAQMAGISQGHHAFHEHMMLVGGFHSGPISSMRYVGVVGYFIYMILSIVIAVGFYRSAKKSIGTPFTVAFLFFGLYWIVHPFYFTFIFGQYDIYAPNLILAAGMLKMLMNSYREYESDKGVPLPVSQDGEPTGAL